MSDDPNIVENISLKPAWEIKAMCHAKRLIVKTFGWLYPQCISREEAARWIKKGNAL